LSAIVAAEILGLDVKDITVQTGESPFGQSSGSGGSTTCPSQAPATLQAAAAARDDLFNKVAKKLGAKPEGLEIVPGGKPGGAEPAGAAAAKIRDKAANKEYAWKQVCSRLGTEQAKGDGFWTFAESAKKENAGISKLGVGGVQVAEVLVDT